MSRVLLIGHCPLRGAVGAAAQVEGRRSGAFLTALRGAGHDVRLMALREEGAYRHEVPPVVRHRLEDGFVYEALRRDFFADPKVHLARQDDWRPEGIVGVGGALVAVTATRAAQIAAQGAPCPVWIDFAVDPIEEIRRDPEAAEMIQQALARADVVSTSTGEREDVLLGQLGFVGRLNRHTVSAKRPAAEIAGEAQGAANGARGIAGMGNAGLTCVIPDDAACDGPAFGPLLSWAARPFFATDRNTLGPNAPLNSLHALFV